MEAFFHGSWHYFEKRFEKLKILAESSGLPARLLLVSTANSRPARTSAEGTFPRE
jgi:hypothetical protein